MAVLLTGTNSLFKRLGVMGGKINSILCNQGLVALTAPSVSWGTFYTSMMAQFTSTSAQSDLFDGFVPNILNAARAKSNEIANLKSQAQALLIRMVDDDTPLKVEDLGHAMTELVRQMGPNVSDSYVVGNAVAATTPTAAAGNTGTAVCISSKTGPLMPHPLEFTTGVATSMDNQNLYPETLSLYCTADSYTGSATVRQETFQLLAPNQLVTDPLIWNFNTLYGALATNGTGVSNTVGVCDASAYQGTSGNLLNNGDFVSFGGPPSSLANIPNQWVKVTGVAGTDFLDGASGFINTSHSLAFTGNSAAPSLTQQFNSVNGSTEVILPNTVYALNLYAKTTASTSGNLLVSLVDGSGNVINDNNAVANTLTQAASGIGTTYGAYHTYFRTPAVLPASGVFLRISMSAVPGAGKTLNVSYMALKVSTPTYPGGQYVDMFAGLTPSVVNDQYNAAFTNDFGGLSNKFGWQWYFNLLFDIRQNGYPQLPVTNVAGSGNLIAASLIA